MAPRRLGRTGLLVTPISFGAFKIGRNEGHKYGREYDLPDVVFELMGQTVILACVSLKVSDWTTSAGRGFPEYAPLVATTTISPRVTSSPSRPPPRQ